MQTILAIDDQRDNLTIIHAIVKSYLKDCKTITANSGAEGLKMIKKNAPDIILLDLIMPEMDGYEVCKRLKNDDSTKHIPIIMITAIKTDMDSRVKALNLGADAFLTKPIDPVELTAQINVMLRIKKAEDELREEKINLEKTVLERTLKLKENEEKYKNLYDKSPLPFHSLDKDGCIIDVNPAWLKTLGYKKNEVILKWYGDFLHDDWKQIFKKNFPILKNCGSVADIPFKIRRRDGNYIDISLNGSSSYHPDGSFKQTYCVFKDITDRNKIEKALIKNERLLIESQKIAGLGSYVLILGKDIWTSSEILDSIFGIDKNYTKTIANWNQLIHEEDREMMMKYLRENILSNHENFDKEYRIKRLNDQSVRWVHGKGQLEFNKEGEVIRMIGTIQDITESKHIEHTLAQQKQRLYNIIEGTNAGTWDWNIQSGDLEINNRWAEIIGFTLEELMPINIDIWRKNLHPEDLELANKSLEDLFNKKTSFYNIEFRMLHKNGDWIWVKANGKITEWTQDGKPFRMSGTHIDITDQKLAQERLHLTQYSIDNLTDAVHWMNSDAEFIYVNTASAKSWGYSKEELLKMKIIDIDPDFNKAKWESHWEEIKERKSFSFRTSHQRKDKSIFPVEVTVNYILYEGQELNYAIAKDITEQIRSENIQRILYNISNASVTSNSVQDFIAQIQIELDRVLDTKNYYVAFYDESTDMVSLPYMADEKDSSTPFVAGKTMTAYVIKTQKPLLADYNKQEEMVNQGEIEFVGPRSKIWLGVPLKTKGKVMGVLAIQSYDDEKAYNESDAELLEFIADQISNSIERKRINDVLRVNEEKYRSLIETTSEGFWLIDRDGVTLEVNKSLCNMLGYSRAQIIGKTPFDFVDDFNAQIFHEQISKADSETQRKYEISLLNKKGDSILTFFSATSVLDIAGKHDGSFAFITDITEQKKADEYIRKSEERFDLAMQASKDGLYDWDLITNEVYFSASWKKMLGYNDDELPNDISIWESLTHPQERDKSLEKLKHAIENKVTDYEVEFRMKHKNGHWVDILSRANFVFDEEGNTIRVVGTHADMTEIKKAEKEIKEALKKAKESDHLKSAFLATMSHELRTPLNAIIGFSDIITEDLSMEEVISFNSTINSSGKHLLNIVEDLFDITLIETGEIKIFKEDFPLLELLNEVAEVITISQQKLQKEHLTIKRKIPSICNPLIIHSDASKMKQILLNLLRNALKFTNEGDIQYGCVIEEINKKSVLKFFVEDTGIGVPQEKQDLIFDIFRQADDSHTRLYGGTGIGLSICKKLTHLLGGDIWIDSTEGKGSTFFFSIPLDDLGNNKGLGNDIKKPKQIADTSSNKESQHTILVVEDIEASYEYLKVILDKSGYKSVWAENGKVAVEVCNNNPDIDLILMDINMPVMNGYEATREIKKLKPNLPIIAQTAYAISGDREKSLEAGCDNYISKPINRKNLISIIKKYIN